MNRRILMWEHHAWDSPIRVGGRAFAEAFLESGWNVAWINGPLAPWNLVRGNDEVARRRNCWWSGGTERSWGKGRLFTYAPMGWIPYRPYPLLHRPWFHRHSLDATTPSLRRILRKRGFEAVDLLWLATGSPMLGLLRRFPQALSLYRLSDDTAGFPDTPRSYREVEEEAMARVDCVVATAESLAQRASQFCRRVLLLPNGVDCRRFTGLDARGGEARDDERRRRIVYVGALDSWFDRRKVQALCRALPQAEVILAGPVRMDIDWARDLANLKLVGPVPPEQVPGLLAGCDVGIIPFVDSPLTRAIHPVKLYEYFAAGLPVVASDLDEIRRIGSPAVLARSESEWVEAVQMAWQGSRRGEFLAFAAANDWSSRFDRLMEFLYGKARQASPPMQRMAR